MSLVINMINRKNVVKLILMFLIVLMIPTISTIASGNVLRFNQMNLFSSRCIEYASNCIMPDEIYTDTQQVINKVIYGQSAVIFNKDHINTCYGDVDTPIFNSFADNVTPLVPLAFSIAEWGGNGDLIYSFTPAIATKRLMNNGVSMSSINPWEINSQYYTAMGCSFSDNTFWGPLQINKSYLNASVKGYKCGFVPMDYYSWPDVCQWTFHDKCKQMEGAWNKEYQFKNEYEVVAHTAIAHNSGGTHISSKNFQLDRNWYPWKSSQAVFDYVSFITNETNLNIIFNDADAYSNDLLEKYKNGEAKGALYKSIGETRTMSDKMGVNWSLYVKGHWLGNMTKDSSLSGDSLRNWEKVMYPVQAIWNYRVLENLYGIME